MRRFLFALCPLVAILASPVVSGSPVHAATKCGAAKQDAGYCATLEIGRYYSSTPNRIDVAISGDVTYDGEPADSGMVWKVDWHANAGPKDSAEGRFETDSPFNRLVFNVRCSAKVLDVLVVGEVTGKHLRAPIVVDERYRGAPCATSASPHAGRAGHSAR